jgi:hypothetical protein
MKLINEDDFVLKFAQLEDQVRVKIVIDFELDEYESLYELINDKEETNGDLSQFTKDMLMYYVDKYQEHKKSQN